MFKDPFEDQPVAEEPPKAPEPAQADSSGSVVYKATVKGTWEGPWISMEMEEPSLTGAGFKHFADMIVKANLYLAQAWDKIGRPHAPTAVKQEEQRRSAPQTDKTGGTGSGVFCDHGERIKRSGVSAKGAWTAAFCPAPKGDPTQCPPIFYDKQGNPKP